MSIDQHQPPVVTGDAAGLAERVRRLVTGDDRVIVGVVGPPGSGKSTLVAAIAEILGAATAVVVPMDGFHLGNALLRGTPRQQRKGAIDTFDAAGYAELIRRLHRRSEDVVYAPRYAREFEEPIAASIAVPREVPVVLTEGNYLLAPTAEWPVARALMDEVWYVDLPDEVRLDRLTRRHVAFGKTEEAAHGWARGTDQDNARQIAGTRPSADLVIASA